MFTSPRKQLKLTKEHMELILSTSLRYSLSREIQLHKTYQYILIVCYEHKTNFMCFLSSPCGVSVKLFEFVCKQIREV